MAGGGMLLIECGNAELPRPGSATKYVTLAIAHTGQEANPEKLFEPSSLAEDGLALATVHGIVAEHGGYISAQATVRGCRFEMLLPCAAEALEECEELRDVPSVLLVDDRERVRAQLHNFFEGEGYNLLEAADDQEALALGEVHEGSLDLLVAEAGDADRIAEALRGRHPKVRVLRIVDRHETSANQIRRPFTQTELLEKASGLLGKRECASAAAISS